MKATYDTEARLVVLDQVAPVGSKIALDVQTDLYSDAKAQWLALASLNKFVFPWQAIGGQALPGGAVASRIFFLRSPWKIHPYEASHELTLSKNVFTDDGRDLLVPTAGAHTVNSIVTTDFGSGDDRISRILDLLEADEELMAGRARKLHRLSKAVLLSKTITGGANVNITLVEEEI